MKVSLTALGTKTLATFADRVIKSSQGGKYTVVANHPLLNRVISEYAIYSQVYSKLTYSGQGKNVAQMDAERDGLFSALRNYIKGTAGLPKAPGNAEAVALYAVFKNYGDNITAMNYADETAQLKKLFTELDKPENTARLQTLNLTEVYADLKQEQQDFEDAYAVQAEANTDLRDLPSASAIRRRLEKTLRKYLDLLTSMQDEDGWQKIYLEISELAKGVNKDNPGQSPDAPKA